MDNNKLHREGVYLVALELEKNGYKTKINYGKTNDYDILAEKNSKKRKVFVKSTTKNNWIIIDKLNIPNITNSSYAFVKLDKNIKNVEYYIANFNDVNKCVSIQRANHKAKNKKGKFIALWDDTSNNYLNKWKKI